MKSIKSTGMVTKSNTLIQTKYKLTTSEQKILLTLASMIQKDDSEFKSYTLSIADFSNLLGVKSNNRYTELRKITAGLMSKNLEIDSEDKLIQTPWLSHVTYHKKKGLIEMRFASDLKPFFLELKKNFTSYRLANIAKLKHSYSIRMYELLKQYQKIGERSFDYITLLEHLGVAQSGYNANYGGFKARVLKPIQKELEKKTDIKFEFEETKVARKVVSLRFIIKKTDIELPTEQEFRALASIKPDIDVVREHLASYDLNASDEIISGWLTHGLEKTMKILNFATEEKSIRNPVGFVIYAYRNNLSTEDLKSTVASAKIETRKELVPDWLREQKEEEQAQEEAQNVEKEKDDEMSEEESKQKLEEERMRLEEVMKKYKRTS
ncbi:replication initiation protein [Bacillus paranthracis]|uniref:replication initiation protein n=1 Tax=Bacillus paranthracis TaxID=2026186 RepID=UPI0021516EC4|nr:replication initiation protein [Bacillus paranthracis]MCR6465160.1 replication initiation protein [Bacillus paranthracis]MCR9021610.1 replication initiation protein [Bacillus paranthracis]